MQPQSPLAISLWVATWAALGALTLGVLIARWFVKTKAKSKLLAEVVVMLPLVLPPTVTGYYLLLLLGQRGIGPWVEQALGLRFVFALPGAVAAAMAAALPLVVQTARSSLAEVSREAQEAARMDGCTEWQVFWWIDLPLAWRGIAAGGTLGFLRALGDFGTVLMVAGNIPKSTQTMAVAIYDAVQANDIGRANSLALVQFAIAFALLYWVLRFSQRVEQRR